MLQNKALPSYVFSVFLACMTIFFLYPPDFLLGNNAYWTLHDAGQHVSGSQVFLQDDWHFPLLKTTRLNAPEGIEIIYTDSIPLAGLVFKLFKSLLPDSFQYIGLWVGVVYVLQAVAAVYLIRSLGLTSFFSAAMATGFVLCAYPFTIRLGHTSLMTHGMILFALGLYFRGLRSGNTSLSFGLRYAVLCVLTLLIHPYLFAMVYPFFLAYNVDVWRAEHKQVLFRNVAISLLLIATTAVVMGYGASGATGDSFGVYSMNLLTIVTGGVFTPASIDATGGQYEGRNYLGLGLLLLLVCALVLERRNLVHMMRRYASLGVLMVLFTLFALSNKAYLGTYLLYDISVPRVLEGLFNIFRSSGRFFWPVFYVLFFFALASVLKQNRLRWSLLVAAALMFQVADMRDTISIARSNARDTVAENVQDYAPLLRNVQRIDVYPSSSSAESHDPFAPPEKTHALVQLLAGHYHKATNTGYFARFNKRPKRDFTNFDRSPDNNVYVAGIRLLREQSHGGWSVPTLFLEAVENNWCFVLRELLICKKNLTLEDMAPFGAEASPYTAH